MYDLPASAIRRARAFPAGVSASSISISAHGGKASRPARHGSRKRPFPVMTKPRWPVSMSIIALLEPVGCGELGASVDRMTARVTQVLDPDSECQSPFHAGPGSRPRKRAPIGLSVLRAESGCRPSEGY